MFKRRRQPKPRYLGLLLLLAPVAGMIALQATAPWTSYQKANLGTGVCGGIALLGLSVWWFRFFSTWGWFRLAPLGFVLGGALLTIIFLEPIGVTGELLPQFRLRFAAPPSLPTSSSAPDSNSHLRWQLTLPSEAFPGFLGPQRNGTISPRAFPLDWQAQPPRMVWKHPLGAGLAGISAGLAIGTGEEGEGTSTRWLLYTLEQRDQEEWVSCYDAADGKLVWHHSYPSYHTHILGDTGPRSTPSIDSSGRVYAQGATGIVSCLDGLTGELRWQVDLKTLAGITQTTSERYVLWGRAASPLLIEDLVVLPLGGDSASEQGSKTLVALEADSGKIRWTSGKHQISYASPVVGTLGGVRQIVSVDEDFASGTAIEDGRVLWTHPWPGKSNTGANCSNPVIYGDDRVLLSKEYGGGAEMIRIGRKGDAFGTEVVWKDNRVLKTKFTNVVVRDSFGYALSNGTLECVDLESGDVRWRQPRRTRFGHGHVLLVDEVLLCTSEEGEVAVVRAEPTGYDELGRFSAVEGKTWNPMAVIGSRLVVRNGVEMSLWEFSPPASITTNLGASSTPVARASQTAPHKAD